MRRQCVCERRKMLEKKRNGRDGTNGGDWISGTICVCALHASLSLISSTYRGCCIQVLVICRSASITATNNIIVSEVLHFTPTSNSLNSNEKKNTSAIELAILINDGVCWFRQWGRVMFACARVRTTNLWEWVRMTEVNNGQWGRKMCYGALEQMKNGNLSLCSVFSNIKRKLAFSLQVVPLQMSWFLCRNQFCSSSSEETTSSIRVFAFIVNKWNQWDWSARRNG